MPTPSPRCRTWLHLLLPACAVLLGCDRHPAPQVPAVNAVATVNGAPIPREAFEDRLARRGRISAAPEEDIKTSVLEDLVREEILYQRALAAGYDRDPEVRADLRRLIIARFCEDKLTSASAPTPDPQEIRTFYDAHRAEFEEPAKARIALIELRVSRNATPDRRRETAAQAEMLRSQASAMEPDPPGLGLLAQENSEHQPSRYRGGDVGWLVQGSATWDPGVTAAAFSLQRPGEVAPVVETPGAFYVLRLIARQEATVRLLEEVKPAIEWRVQRKKEKARETALHGVLREGMDVRVNEPLLKSIAIPQTPAAPPTTPQHLSETRHP